MPRCFHVINLKLFIAVTMLKVKLRIIKNLKLNNKISRMTKINLMLFHIHKMALRAFVLFSFVPDLLTQSETKIIYVCLNVY